MSKKTSIQKRTPGSLHPAGSAASSELEVVPKCVTTLADAYEKGMVVMGGRRAGRTWAMRIATAKPPPWRYCTLTPESFERLRHDPAFKSDNIPHIGIEIHVKHGQVADSWMFSDSKTLQRYLTGELSELDLMELMRTGACQPNGELSDRTPKTNNDRNAT